MSEAILEVKDLRIDYPISIGTVRAVEGVSFTLNRGEVLGLVGESGCGKSTLGLSMLRLIRPPGKISGGNILYKGRDIIKMSEREILKLRGQNIAMVFQNPLTSLNPLFTVKHHFLETIHYHKPEIEKDKAIEMTGNILENLGIDSERMHEYPHQLSGGMRQRIMIGLGLIMEPDILIADEPTTSLDVIVEAGFIDLLNRLREKFNLSIILITHNLGLVAEIADRVAVMYGGKLMEVGTADEIFSEPLHPYTFGLINCIPNIKLEQKELVTMPGNPPDLVNPPKGCRFAPRCTRALDVCKEKTPELIRYKSREIACWLYKKGIVRNGKLN